MASLEIEQAAKSYGRVEVMSDINRFIDNGEFAVFKVPSGCVISTLHRMIEGLEEITEGAISIGEEKSGTTSFPCSEARRQ